MLHEEPLQTIPVQDRTEADSSWEHPGHEGPEGPEGQSRPYRTGPAVEPIPDAERQLAMAAHLSGGLVSFVGPLAIRYFGPGRAGSPPTSAWYTENVSRALHFQVFVFALWVLTWPLACIPIVGWIPNALLLGINALLACIAGAQAYHGKLFSYPVDFRFASGDETRPD